MRQSLISLFIIILVLIGIIVFLMNYSRGFLKYPVSTPNKKENPAPPKSETSKLTEKVKTKTILQIKKAKDEIKTKVQGEIIKYQEKSFYSGDDFRIILENQDKYKAQLINNFQKKIIGVKAENCKVDFNELENSATLECDIKGAEYGANSYSMHFLLGNWPFDLYQFKEYQKKLVYNGKINGVPTYIVFEFPYAISHCHEHVWPR